MGEYMIQTVGELFAVTMTSEVAPGAKSAVAKFPYY